jgi:AcrR family transcriptional regulator
MRRIAEKIDYSPTTIYLHFKDKAELFHFICEETFSRLSTRIEAALAPATDPIEALVMGLTEYVDFGLEHPNHYRVVFMDPNDPSEEPEHYLREGSFELRTYNFLRQRIGHAVLAGAMPALDVELASQALWCVAHGLTANLIASRKFPWVERRRLIDFTLRVALRGLSHP